MKKDLKKLLRQVEKYVAEEKVISECGGSNTLLKTFKWFKTELEFILLKGEYKKD